MIAGLVFGCVLVWCLGFAGLVYGVGYERAVISVARVAVMAPLCTVLAAGAVVLFDGLTPGRWCERLLEGGRDNVGVGLVLGALVYSVFWVCVQG